MHQSPPHSIDQTFSLLLWATKDGDGGTGASSMNVRVKRDGTEEKSKSSVVAPQINDEWQI